MSNPWMSLWLSAANSWAGAMRSFWTAEMNRQQTANLDRMSRQAMDFWIKTWMAPIMHQTPRRRR